MTDEQCAELKRLSEEMQVANGVDISALSDKERMEIIRKGASFMRAANPAAVLDLLAENERLRAALDVLERCAHAVIVDCVETRDVGGLSLASEACTNARRLLES